MKFFAAIIAIAVAFGIGSYIGAKPACGEECVAGITTTMGSMSASNFYEAVNQSDATIIDVRTAEEFSEGHIEEAIQQDFYQTASFETFLDELDKDKKYLIYCRSGNRSSQALELMRQKGFSSVSDLSGGISAWKASGYQTER